MGVGGWVDGLDFFSSKSPAARFFLGGKVGRGGGGGGGRGDLGRGGRGGWLGRGGGLVCI